MTILIKRLMLIALVAVLLNYIWEMLQMPFFVNMKLSDVQTWFICLRASGSDALIILLIVTVGRLIFGQWVTARIPDRESIG